MFRSLWNNYEQTLRKQLDRIEHQSRLVESECSVAKFMVDETRHEEIKRMLTTNILQTPGTLPCHSIPFGQNMGFFGRTNELQNCRNTLSPSNTLQRMRGVALYGVGGVGKTSIALQIAYEEKSRRSAIFWFAADDPAKLAEGFSDAAVKLDLHQANANATTDRNNLKGWLEKTSRCWKYSTRTATNL